MSRIVVFSRSVFVSRVDSLLRIASIAASITAGSLLDFRPICCLLRQIFLLA
jgi:hypothetical protein